MTNEGWEPIICDKCGDEGPLLEYRRLSEFPDITEVDTTMGKICQECYISNFDYVITHKDKYVCMMSHTAKANNFPFKNKEQREKFNELMEELTKLLDRLYGKDGWSIINLEMHV